MNEWNIYSALFYGGSLCYSNVGVYSMYREHLLPPTGYSAVIQQYKLLTVQLFFWQMHRLLMMYGIDALLVF